MTQCFRSFDPQLTEYGRGGLSGQTVVTPVDMAVAADLGLATGHFMVAWSVLEALMR